MNWVWVKSLNFDFDEKPKKGGKKKAGKKSRSVSPDGAAGGKAKSKEPGDFLNPIALTNAYYITHAATDGLQMFGFKWEGAKKKKKKK